MRIGRWFIFTLIFLELGQQAAARPQETTKRPAARTVSVTEAERIFQALSPRLAVLEAMQAGKIHSLASAIVLASDGFLGTNNHAIQGADEVDVIIPDSSANGQPRIIKNLKLRYSDDSTDLAILKADVNGLPFLGCSPDPNLSISVGEKVYALGNPRGLESSISDGIISGLRTIDGQDLIQHTAPISPGSSGGALVDSRGVLLGVNAWQLRDSQNLNFAIPRKYVCEALVTAEHSTAPLAFPKEEQGSDDTFGELARKALDQGDYIQAINQATQAVAAGQSSAEIYTVLTAAYYHSGDRKQAETYARQCLALTDGAGDEFKQTARLYLLNILRDNFRENPALVDRLTLLKLVNEFVGSNSAPIVDNALYQETKGWAASFSNALKSIAGIWKDASDNQGLCSAFRFDGYKISGDDDGGFRLSPEGVTHSENGGSSFTWQVSGTIHVAGEAISGSLEEYLIGGSDGNVALGRQTVNVELKLSDDLMSLEGVANHGAIRASGNMADVALTLMGPCRGEREIKLVRSQ